MVYVKNSIFIFKIFNITFCYLIFIFYNWSNFWDFFEHLFKKIQQVIVMTVIPGFGGQRFMENQVQKIKELKDIRKKNNYNFEISVDGGINNETGKLCIENGVDVLAVGSYLLSQDDQNYISRSLILLY